MSSNRILSEKGLTNGSVVVTIDSVEYLLKTYDLSKPVRRSAEYDADGHPLASHFVKDFESYSVEIMAISGTQEPSQLVAFSLSSKLWCVGNLNKKGSTEGLTSYSAEIHALASTSSGTISTTA